MIDFEQLKIENQTYNEKIVERNEDLTKLGNKIESAVQVLTHMKEKLDFVTMQNTRLQQKLQEVEVESTASRDKLGKMKLARDMLRRENTELQQNMGLLGKEVSLRQRPKFIPTMHLGSFVRFRVANTKKRRDECRIGKVTSKTH